MAKLTLSIDRDIVRDAKHHALDLGTTVSALVTEGLQNVLAETRRTLHTLAQLMLRAWHHFPDGMPFIIPAILAFQDMGFEVEPQKTGFQLRMNGQHYVVKHTRSGGQMLVRVQPWGKPQDAVVEVNVSDLARRVKQVKTAGEYSNVIKAIWDLARKVKTHAEQS